MGRNSFNQLGLGVDSSQDQKEPVILGGDSNEDFGNVSVKEIACGAFHSLFLLETGDVYSTGWNYHGQLGQGCSDFGPGSLAR